jgi:hypothetical protein
MNRSIFLLIAAVGSFVFGGILFFVPDTGAAILGIAATPGTLSLIHGLGGLIIGSATINWLARKLRDYSSIRAVLIANIVTHAFGLAADIWGIADGALSIAKMALVELTHLFIGVGSGIYLVDMKRAR